MVQNVFMLERHKTVTRNPRQTSLLVSACAEEELWRQMFDWNHIPAPKP